MVKKTFVLFGILAVALIILFIGINVRGNGYTSTTITINSSQMTDNIIFQDLNLYKGSMLKINISQIPNTATEISDAELCMNITDVSGSILNDTFVGYVANQTWNESMDWPGIGAIKTLGVADTNSTVNLTLTDKGFFACLNVTTQLAKSFSNGDKFFSILFESANYIVGTVNGIGGIELAMGDFGGTFNYFGFGSRNMTDASSRPYLNVTYLSLSSSGSANQSSEGNMSEWRMFGRWLNHTAWDGVAYPTVPGLNNANYTTGGIIDYSSAAIVNGYAYFGSNDGKIYQLNATNVSQLISSYTTATSIFSSSPAVVNGYLYIGSYTTNKLYQLNATNVSQSIANYTATSHVGGSPIVANGCVYVGSSDGSLYQLNATNVSQSINKYTALGAISTSASPAATSEYIYAGSSDFNVYQLNATNITQLIATYPTGGVVLSSPAVSNGYVYVGSYDNNVYQLNATNVSQLISSYTTGGFISSSPAVANGYVYVGSQIDHKLYQLNASNVSQLIASYGGEV